MQTHTVFNQSKPLVDYDMFNSDPILQDLVERYEASWSSPLLSSFGEYAGSAQAIEWAELANRNEPVLHNFDRFGNRIDKVEFHPSYHQLMQKSIEFGTHNLPWTESRSGSQIARAALMYMDFQNEAGHCCPISMTFSVLPSLRKQEDLASVWEPLIKSKRYDSRYIPAFDKEGVTVGMAMTEKQGGSDVRANTTTAAPVAESGAGRAYFLTGHKWFCSAPMSDAFLMLAQTEKGLSCFLVPRFGSDGKLNHIFVQRLKDKLGNKSNASSEIELDSAIGYLIGEEGRGVPTIIEMVNHTRLDCIIGASALMRQASLQALHHCKHRSAFGKLLIDQPLMVNVLADLFLESESATRLMMRIAASYEQDVDSEQERLFKRIGSAIAKYWVCKRAPAHVAEALECFGGNGYVESAPMARLFRESPLLGIWEGSGNVICLDVLRAAAKEPEALDAFVAELERSSGSSKRIDSQIAIARENIGWIKKNFAQNNKSGIEQCELSARRVVEQLAVCLQASLMCRQSNELSAEVFANARLERRNGLAFGTIDCSLAEAQSIIKKAFSL